MHRLARYLAALKHVVVAGLGVLPGCAHPGKAATPTTANQVAADIDEPRPYLALVELGRRWTFDVAVEDLTNADDSSSTTEISCWAADVRVDLGGTHASIDCDPLPKRGVPLSGVYTLTDAGLWTSSEASTPLAAPSVPYLDAEPIDDDLGGGSLGVEVTHQHGDWCIRDYDDNGGIIGSSKVCLGAGGLTTGLATWNGAPS